MKKKQRWTQLTLISIGLFLFVATYLYYPRMKEDKFLKDQSITYNNSSSDSTMLKYRYKHIAKADIEVVYKRVSLGGSVRYNSFMTNVDKIFTEDFIGGDNGMIPGINAAREKFKDGDFIVDLRAGYQITKTARIGFIINNLLNREYMSRPANMMPPRTFAMQLALKI